MITRNTNTRKTRSFTTTHFNARLRKIRSLKTSSLKSNPPTVILAAARTPTAKPFVKSILPYGLVIASLALSGGAMATEAHAKTAKPAHAVTHVARRRAAPAQQPDFVAQFFQGLFPSMEQPTYETSPPDNSAAADAQAASDAEVQAIQQMNDTNALNASMAAAEQQNDAANAATLQTEINAGM
jgi:hypothetical protein